MTYKILAPTQENTQSRTSVLATSESNHCLNCGPTKNRIVRGRCHICYEYLRQFGKERPVRVEVVPTWAKFEPTPKEIDQGAIWCDCGKPATQTLTLPIAERGKATLLLCDDCAALERRLAPVHSWAGG
jgi:hypothetical protein